MAAEFQSRRLPIGLIAKFIYLFIQFICLIYLFASASSVILAVFSVPLFHYIPFIYLSIYLNTCCIYFFVYFQFAPMNLATYRYFLQLLHEKLQLCLLYFIHLCMYDFASAIMVTKPRLFCFAVFCVVCFLGCV